MIYNWSVLGNKYFLGCAWKCLGTRRHFVGTYDTTVGGQTWIYYHFVLRPAGKQTDHALFDRWFPQPNITQHDPTWYKRPTISTMDALGLPIISTMEALGLGCLRTRCCQQSQTGPKSKPSPIIKTSLIVMWTSLDFVSVLPPPLPPPLPSGHC